MLCLVDLNGLGFLPEDVMNMLHPQEGLLASRREGIIDFPPSATLR